MSEIDSASWVLKFHMITRTARFRRFFECEENSDWVGGVWGV